MPASDRRNTAIRLVVSAVVLAGAYVGLSVWASAHVPANAAVGTIQIGGMSTQDASASIEQAARKLLATPIVVTVPDSETTFPVEPGKAGLSVDVERSLDGLVGFTLNPATVWDKLTGSITAPLVTRVDDEALTGYLERVAPSVAAPAVDGRITFPNGKVTVTMPETGRSLDIAGTKLALRRAFPDATTAVAAVRPVPPTVPAAEYQKVADDFGERAMSGPVTLVVDGKQTALTPKQFAPAVTVVAERGVLTPTFDEKKLASILGDRIRITTTKARDARWTFEPNNGRPKLVPSVDGTAVDQPALIAQVIAAISSADSRSVTVTAAKATPSFTTAQATAAGVRELVVDFRSPFPSGDPTRTNNLVVATRTINGTYVPPGGVFSLNGVLGERTTAKGYADGTVIINGRLTRGTGGGVSQVSTTIYNMAYFAGADIIEATPHAFFIPRYPEGREATVYWPTVDNKWKNDTQYGMLLQTWVADGYVHGRVWSTKTWEVRSIKGERRNVVAPKTIRDDGARCYPQQPNPGFDVTVTRQWYRPGSTTLVKSEDVHTHYIPENEIICTNPDARP